MQQFLRSAVGLSALLASTAWAQTTRWNDAAPALGAESDPPIVSVWLDRQMFSLGEPVRVGFRVEEDAYVVVARVDWDGNLTVLYPRGRGYRTEATGGRDTYIPSARMGARGTFVANERSGGTGYVFALASRAPLDLSRLSQRDFSSWVTGIPRSRPTTRYVGDPYRVVQRFARLVLYDPMVEWDYDVAFYSVDSPSWVTTASAYGNYCVGYGARGMNVSAWGTRLSEYDDDLFWGYGNSFGCRSLYNYTSCYSALYGVGYYVPLFCGRPRYYGGQVANGPVPPPVRGDDDERPVNGWVPDSIGRPNVDVKTNGGGNANGPHVMTVDRDRPAPAGWNARDDLSFSIPARALRGLRERREPAGTQPLGGGVNSGPAPMPSRPTPEVTREPVEWVRPPRAFEPATRDVERLPQRGAIRREQAASRGPDRGMREFSPPVRTSSPVFDREPIRSPYGGTRGLETGGRGYNPPGWSDTRPVTHPGLESRPMSNPGASAPPTPSSPPPAQPATSGGAKTAEPPVVRPPGDTKH